MRKSNIFSLCNDVTMANESYCSWAVLSYGTIYYAVEGSSNFLVCWMKSYGVSCGVTIQIRASEHTVYYAVTVVLSFKSLG